MVHRICTRGERRLEEWRKAETVGRKNDRISHAVVSFFVDLTCVIDLLAKKKKKKKDKCS